MRWGICWANVILESVASLELLGGESLLSIVVVLQLGSNTFMGTTTSHGARMGGKKRGGTTGIILL